MSEQWMTIFLGDRPFPVRLHTGRAPAAVEVVRASLPRTVRLLHTQWSGFFLESVERFDLTGVVAPADAYQEPGGLYLDQETGALCLCYGKGRLQDGIRLSRAVPVGQVVGDLDDFATICSDVQFNGVLELRLDGVTEQDAPAAPAPSEPQRFAVTLGSARVTAAVLESTPRAVAAAWLGLLPLEGVATNTHSSGPLLRFWNKVGGAQGETPLDAPADLTEGVDDVLRPGLLYYLAKPGFRGIRMPIEAPTAMRSAVRGGGLALLGIAQLDGDWSELQARALRLRWTGALPMTFSRL